MGNELRIYLLTEGYHRAMEELAAALAERREEYALALFDLLQRWRWWADVLLDEGEDA